MKLRILNTIKLRRDGVIKPARIRTGNMTCDLQTKPLSDTQETREHILVWAGLYPIHKVIEKSDVVFYELGYLEQRKVADRRARLDG